MHPLKERYSKEVISQIVANCRNLSDDQYHPEPTIAVLKITQPVMVEIVKKIMIALPDRHFYNATPIKLADILSFIVTNFILFECQENINSEMYPYDLINFINTLSDQIEDRYYSSL